MRATVRVGEYVWRPLTDSDADTEFVVRLRNNERFRNMFYNTTVTAETHKKFIRAADERGEINWLIEQDGGQFVGLASMYHFDYTNRKAECGRIAMLDPKLFHMNWMVSAFTGMDVVGTYKLWIETLEENHIVARGLERIGMVKEGLLRWHVIRDGKPLNVWYFGGTTETWHSVGPGLVKRFGPPKLISFEGKRMLPPQPTLCLDQN